MQKEEQRQEKMRVVWKTESKMAKPNLTISIIAYLKRALTIALSIM